MTQLGKILDGAFPEAPRDGWKTCGGCGEAWASLEPSGLCYECDGARRAEIVAQAKRGRHTREDVLAASSAPARVRVAAFREPRRWPVAVGAEVGVDAWEGVPELLTLAGPTDTGKSTMAAELLWRRGGGRWVVAAQIPDAKIHDRERYQRLLTAPILVVDELGRGHNRDAWELVYGVIGERWEAMRPTICTTNFSLEHLLSEAAHPALGRRLRDGWWVPLKSDWRGR